MEFALEVPRDCDLFERELNGDWGRYTERMRASRPDVIAAANRVSEEIAARGWDYAVLVDILY